VDWEDWLRNAAKRPSDNEDSKRESTESQIREALASYAPLDGKKYRVYTKGSYANNTNVRLDYDVDIAVEYYGYFYSDLTFELEGHDKSEVNVVDSDDPYSRAEFKSDVLEALRDAFGKTAVSVGNIAYRVREKKTTLPADVVPCWEYRRYDSIDSFGNPISHVGSRVYPNDGGYINNFPKIQLDRGIAKNIRTGRRYKRMVRALKKLQTKLVADGLLDEELPSYFTECLVFNVPDERFNHSTYLADMREVLASIFNETLASGNYADWKEVHGLKYLFHGDFKRTKAHHVADVAWDAIGFE
jgi:hypothetical protein